MTLVATYEFSYNTKNYYVTKLAILLAESSLQLWKPRVCWIVFKIPQIFLFEIL